MILSDVWCLSVAYIGPKSRTERPRKTKIGTGVAHVTRDSVHHFQGQKVKGQGHQAALLSAALTRKAAAAVSVGTYSAWESTATLRLLVGARGAWAPTGRRGAGHIVSPRAQLYVSVFMELCRLKTLLTDSRQTDELTMDITFVVQYSWLHRCIFAGVWNTKRGILFW